VKFAKTGWTPLNVPKHRTTNARSNVKFNKRYLEHSCIKKRVFDSDSFKKN
jgi:hypothetical protein